MDEYFVSRESQDTHTHAHRKRSPADTNDTQSADIENERTSWYRVPSTSHFFARLLLLPLLNPLIFLPLLLLLLLLMTLQVLSGGRRRRHRRDRRQLLRPDINIAHTLR